MGLPPPRQLRGALPQALGRVAVGDAAPLSAPGRSIVDIVSRHAAGRDVRTVHIRIGQLRQIVPDTLVHCWWLINEDTPLAAAELQVESIPGAIRCRTCSHDQTITDAVLTCGSCGGQQVEIVAGEEFLITTLELAEV